MTKKAILILLLASILRGAMLVLTKVGLNAGLDPLSFSSITTLLEGILCVFYIIHQRKSIKKIKKISWRNLIIIGIIASGTVQLTTFVGQSLTTAVNTGFLMNMTTFFTIGFAYFMIGERIQKSKWIPVVIALIGVFFLTTDGILQIPQMGDLLILFAAVQLGFTNSFAKKTMKKIPSNFVSAMRLIIGGIFIFLVVFLLLGSNLFSVLIDGFWYIVAMAVIATVFVF